MESSRHSNKVPWRENRTTMRADEGHEISEEISVSKAGISCTKPDERNFQVSERLVR